MDHKIEGRVSPKATWCIVLLLLLFAGFLVWIAYGVSDPLWRPKYYGSNRLFQEILYLLPVTLRFYLVLALSIYLAILAQFSVLRAIRNSPIIEIDSDGITLHSLIGLRKMPWSKVTSISYHPLQKRGVSKYGQFEIKGQANWLWFGERKLKLLILASMFKQTDDAILALLQRHVPHLVQDVEIPLGKKTIEQTVEPMVKPKPLLPSEPAIVVYTRSWTG
jgi:hypothetical protein